MHDWYGNNGGDWGWGWLPMLIMMSLFFILATWAVVTLVRRDHHHPLPPAAGTGPPDGPTQARRILDERFARGEIDEEEYGRRRRVLTGDS